MNWNETKNFHITIYNVRHFHHQLNRFRFYCLTNTISTRAHFYFIIKLCVRNSHKFLICIWMNFIRWKHAKSWEQHFGNRISIETNNFTLKNSSNITIGVYWFLNSKNSFMNIILDTFVDILINLLYSLIKSFWCNRLRIAICLCFIETHVGYEKNSWRNSLNKELELELTVPCFSFRYQNVELYQGLLELIFLTGGTKELIWLTL